MTIVETILIVVLALVAAALIAAVMMQQGKGAEIGAAFGSGSANTIFGSAGIASPLARLTWGLVTVFFALSLTLAYLAKQRASEAEVFLPRDVPSAPTTQAPPTSDVPISPSETPRAGATGAGATGAGAVGAGAVGIESGVPAVGQGAASGAAKPVSPATGKASG